MTQKLIIQAHAYLDQGYHAKLFKESTIRVEPGKDYSLKGAVTIY